MPKTRRAVESESNVSVAVADQILSQLDELEKSVTSEDDLKSQIQIIQEACQQKLLNWRYNSLTDKVKKLVKDSEFYKNAELKTFLNKLTVVTAKGLRSEYDECVRVEKGIKFGPKLDVSMFYRGDCDGDDVCYIVSINGEEIFDGAEELSMEILTEDVDDKDENDEDEEESDEDEENDAMTVEEKSPAETKKSKAYFQQKAGSVSSPLLRAYYQLELQTVPKEMFFKFVLYILQDVMGAMHWSARDAEMS